MVLGEKLTLAAPKIANRSETLGKLNYRIIEIDDREVGEYLLGSSAVTDKALAKACKEIIGDVEIGLTDPEGVLDLEYGVYLKIDIDSLEHMCLDTNIKKVAKWVNQ